MDGETRASRRAILRSGLLAVGALAGVIGLSGVAERMRDGTRLTLDRSGTTTLRLYGSSWRLAAPGLIRGDLPKRGDQVSISGVLSHELGAQPVGAFFASVHHLDGAVAHGPYSSVQLETHTFQLPGGNLIGMGSTTSDGASEYTVVGGTGRFLGVTGSYTSRQSPLETGGDGTAEFTMTLKGGR